MDTLSIINVIPDVPPGGVLTDVCFDFPCGHFSLDTLELAPVPLPAAGLLLLGGLVVAGLARRRSAG